MPADENQQRTRLAGYNERRCIARDTLGLYGCVAVVDKYSVPHRDFKDATIEDLASKALNRCIGQHPALSTVVHDAETERPRLVRRPDIDLRDHLHILPAAKTSQPNPLQSLLEMVHNEPLTDYGLRPQWRLYVQPVSGSASEAASFHIVFACSHALADGMSLAIFHACYLQALQEGSTELVAMAGPVEAILPAALDKAATFPISWSFFGKVLAGEFLPGSVARLLGAGPQDAAWHGADARPALPPSQKLIRTAVRVTRLEQDVLIKVLTACKVHQARLTGLLNQLMAHSLSSALAKRGQTHITFTAETPYDLRRRIPSAKGQMANYVSAVNHVIVVQSSTEMRWEMSSHDWKAAQRMTSHLASSASTLKDQVIALLAYVSSFRTWVLKRATSPSQASFSISNLGTFIAPGSVETSDHRAEPMAWTVDEMVFCQSADACGEPLNVNVASVKGGELVITMTWWPGMLGVEDEEPFVEEVCAGLVRRLGIVAAEV